MPRIEEEVLLKCTREIAFRELADIDFMRRLDPNFGLDTEILFHNARLLISLSKVKGIGNVQIERVTLPEVFTLITERRPPMAPFTYQLSIQMLFDHAGGTLLKWIDEFELDSDNKQREGAILSYIRTNDVANLRKTQEHLACLSEKRHL
jgi:hypothetical protein